MAQRLAARAYPVGTFFHFFPEGERRVAKKVEDNWGERWLDWPHGGSSWGNDLIDRISNNDELAYFAPAEH